MEDRKIECKKILSLTILITLIMSSNALSQNRSAFLTVEAPIGCSVYINGEMKKKMTDKKHTIPVKEGDLKIVVIDSEKGKMIHQSEINSKSGRMYEVVVDNKENEKKLNTYNFGSGPSEYIVDINGKKEDDIGFNTNEVTYDIDGVVLLERVKSDDGFDVKYTVVEWRLKGKLDKGRLRGSEEYSYSNSYIVGETFERSVFETDKDGVDYKVSNNDKENDLIFPLPKNIKKTGSDVVWTVGDIKHRTKSLGKTNLNDRTVYR
jgi:hypothetical protein